jgi:hypothetical protein
VVPPRVLSPTVEQLRILQEVFGFEGAAVVLVMPPTPESAVLRELRGVMQRVEGLAGDVKAVTHAHQELRCENERLRAAEAALGAIQAEGLLTFVHALDVEAFKLAVAVLAQGDVAKAARALDLDLEQVRWKLRTWRKSKGVYRRLAELIKWRKGKRMLGLCEYKDALAKVASGTDRETVLSEVLSGLMSMTEGNWQDVCAELRLELRKLVG